MEQEKKIRRPSKKFLTPYLLSFMAAVLLSIFASCVLPPERMEISKSITLVLVVSIPAFILTAPACLIGWFCALVPYGSYSKNPLFWIAMMMIPVLMWGPGLHAMVGIFPRWAYFLAGVLDGLFLWLFARNMKDLPPETLKE